MANYMGDPFARRFDHVLALTGYGLLFISVFTFWVPAVVAAAVAFTHKRGADWRTASHFRFQLTIFWISFATGVLGVALLLAAGGFAVSALWAMAVEARAFAVGATAGALTVTGLALFVVSALWTVCASLWGAYRLATNRPIGQSAPGRALEP